MIDNFEKNIQSALERIALSSEDKALMRERLVSYMQLKPIRHKRDSASTLHIPSFIFFRKHHFSGALAIALMATVSTFGVSSAADGALPGDLLYPVKVNINEEIKTVFFSSDEDILEWERERAEMRLKEASQLASEGRLSTEQQVTVSKLLLKHTDAVAEKIQAVEGRDPLLAAQVSNDFEVSLGTHEAVLARLIVEQEDGSGTDEGSRVLVEQVRTAAKEVGELREGAEQIIAADESTDDGVTDEEGVDDGVVVTTVDILSPKVNSANLRERAAYRAAVNATQEGEIAREAVSKLDPESVMALQATTQIKSGEQSLAKGAQFLAENELGKAYGSFRRAGVVFRKVSLLLEALDLFSIEILHETVVEELPEEERETDETSPDTLETESTETSDTQEEANASNDAVRKEAEDKLTQARAMLLTLDGFDEETVLRTNALMKDAMAHIMRGEIATVLGDEGDAYKLYTIGFTQAERVLDLLLRSAATQSVILLTPPETEPATEESSSTTPLTLAHQFSDGTHVWTGSFETPSACSTLETGALVAESYPEQVTLMINVVETNGVACASVVKSASFKISATASAEATVVAVKVNGEDIPHSIIEE